MTKLAFAMLSATAMFAAGLLAASAHAAAPPADPCSLLTAEQVGKLLRGTYAAPSSEAAPRPYPNSGPGTDCRYDGRTPLLFRIYYDGSANDATALFAKVKPFFAPNTPVSGVGDEAYFDSEGDLHARKGNVRFFLQAGRVWKDQLTTLGTIVAGQL